MNKERQRKLAARARRQESMTARYDTPAKSAPKKIKVPEIEKASGNHNDSAVPVTKKINTGNAKGN